MAVNMYFVYCYIVIRKQTFGLVGEERRVDVLCSGTSFDNEPCRDPRDS